MTISTQLEGLKEFRFKAVLDSKDIETIKAEQKTLKEDYEQHLNKHKETLNQLRESEKSILSNHRDELDEYSHYQIGLTGPVGACLLQV